MSQIDGSYVFGTSAEKIEKVKYDVYEENQVLKAKKKAKSFRKAKLETVGAILLLFAVTLALTYRYALITELNYKMAVMEKTYNDIRNENSRYAVAIEKTTDLAAIRDAAEQKLGMQKPDRYQVVYLDVKRTDNTTLSEKYANKVAQGDTGITSFVGRAFGIAH